MRREMTTKLIFLINKMSKTRKYDQHGGRRCLTKKGFGVR